VAALFVVAMFFSPLASAIPSYATAPALIAVGALMAQSVARIEWSDFTEAAPAFVTIITMPLTFSIATGLSLGLICFTLVKVAAGKSREVNLLVWVLTGLFIARYVYLALR
jgi:AGZA family xanthine/uracil permease-like MFS transporter